MHSFGIIDEEELRGQPANPGSLGKMAVKTDVCVCVLIVSLFCSTIFFPKYSRFR